MSEQLGEHGITLAIVQATGKPGKFLAIAANGVGELHRDTIDLNSATSRKRFLRDAMRVAFPAIPPDDHPNDVREELDRQLTAAAICPPGPAIPPPKVTDPTADDPRSEALEKMPDDVRAEAAELLNDPSLLERIAAAVQKRGVVGERLNALTIYLAGTSAQLTKPLSLIVRGASTSGKSYIVDCVADLFPPEVVLFATSLTTNALYYFPPGVLRHRWIVGGERSRIEDDDKAEATRALREMIETGWLRKAVPNKVNDRMVTEVIEQQGPISYIETTTLGTIFEEDANRCLLISTDECEEQTERILNATAATAAGHQSPDLERLRAVHYAIQRMLPRCDVTIPFAEDVAKLYPTDRLDARRSFRHLLVLVKASALLHHRQRGRDAAGNVIATINDYAVAEALARGPLGSAARGVSEGACRFFIALRGKFGVEEFTTTQAQQHGVGEGSRRTRYARLNELHGAGAVEQTDAPKGRVPAKWRLSGVDPNEGPSVLPSVEDVLKLNSGCTHAPET